MGVRQIWHGQAKQKTQHCFAKKPTHSNCLQQRLMLVLRRFHVMQHFVLPIQAAPVYSPSACAHTTQLDAGMSMCDARYKMIAMLV